MAGRRGRGAGGGGHEGGGGEERWLLPYSDMITLLLGLFIVLFAMSTIDAKKFDEVKHSLAQTFNGAVLDGSGDVLDGSNGVLDPTSPSQAVTDSQVSIDAATRATDAKYQQETQRLQQLAQSLGAGKDVEVVRTELGIQISIAGDALFESGSYELSQPGLRDQLTKVQRELQRFGGPIRIEGHTDGQPLAGEFGNRKLSAMRALAVEDYFLGLGFPEDRIHIAAFGDTMPKVPPKHPHDSVAANRRIEIIVLEPDQATPSASSPHADFATPGGKPLPTPPIARTRAASPADQVQTQIDRQLDPAAAGGGDPLVDEIAQAGQ